MIAFENQIITGVARRGRAAAAGGRGARWGVGARPRAQQQSPPTPAAAMVKFMKNGKVVVLLTGRFAGRKAVIVKNYDEGTPQRPYGHAIVCGINKYPRKVRAARERRRASGGAGAGRAGRRGRGQMQRQGRGQWPGQRRWQNQTLRRERRQARGQEQKEGRGRPRREIQE